MGIRSTGITRRQIGEIKRHQARWITCLVLAAGVSASGGGQPGSSVPTVRRWITAVLAHHPGDVDQALRDIAAIPSGTYGVLRSDIDKALREEFRDPKIRDEVRYRGAVLHTDIALLLPDEAGAFKPNDAVTPPRSGQLDRMGRPIAKPEASSLVYMVDGRYLTSDVESGHWPFARQLLAGVSDVSSDAFVRLWYRAIAATFLGEYRYGNATFHLKSAMEVLPRDPILLFFSGALQEALTSGRVRQSRATPSRKTELVMGQFKDIDPEVPTERAVLATAERYFREALRYGGPAEAEIRLGRVMGRAGRHREAVELLARTGAPAGSDRLAYFRELFLATEYQAVGKTEEARRCLDRAAAFFPTAQTPLIALSDLERTSGNRTGMVDVLRRLEALPADASGRLDPWSDYYRSYASDADAQLSVVRAGLNDRRTR
jgi:hypothetical protein